MSPESRESRATPMPAADVERLLQASRRLADRSLMDWRGSWNRVRAGYAAALSRDLASLAHRVGMAGATLEASIAALLDGLEPDTLRRRSALGPTPEVSLVVLAASVPGLAAQPLFPLLCRGSAVILKPSAREPDTARVLVEVLEEVDREAAAAVALRPDLRIEGNLSQLPGVDRVVVYGDDATVATVSGSLRHGPHPPRVSPRGHGWSVVYLDEGSTHESVLAAVAREVALFDQRGCLCPQIVVTPTPAAQLISGLGEALVTAAERLPPAPTTAGLGALRQIREAAVAAGLAVSQQPISTGVVVEGDPRDPVAGTPGGRSLRVYGDLPPPAAVDLLQPIASRVQSIAIAVPDSRRKPTHDAFAALGVIRLVAPGQLHSPGFDWVESQLNLT